MKTPTQKQHIRQLIRLKRKQLSPSQQAQKASQLLNVIMQQPIFMNSQHIACYWPFEGEISPLPLLEQAIAMKKQCYLPVLNRSKPYDLLFVHYQLGDPLKLNHYGILEPYLKLHPCIPAQNLDLVLTPLIAFNDEGKRLGMGGGYYDRTFAFFGTQSKPKKPYLLGLAYEFQRVDDLPISAFDIPLQGIATEERFLATFED